MASFTDIITGHNTLAADVNQLVDALNGTVSTQVLLYNSAATYPLATLLSAAPGSDTMLIDGYVSGDTTARIATYVRGSDGYGGIEAGAGTSLTAKWYAQSSGWKTDQSVTIAGALTVSGTTSLAGLTTSGSATISGNLTVSGTISGTISGSNVSGATNGNVAKTGDTMTGQLAISQALGGSSKTFLELTATDGKDYKWIQQTSGKLQLWNNTDSVSVAEFGPTAGTITANNNTVWTSANDGSGSGLDADKLDGVQGSGYLLTTPTGARVYIQSSTPSSPNKYDLWARTYF